MIKKLWDSSELYVKNKRSQPTIISLSKKGWMIYDT